MNRSRLAIGAVTAMLLLSACSSGSGATAAPKGGTGGTLEGPTWVLKSYDATGKMTDVPQDVYADAAFKGGTVNGSGGCNVFSGSYTASGSALTIGPLATTMMSCEPAKNDVETAYLAALGKSATYTATADTLTIYDSAGTEILLYNAGSPNAITGVTWHVLSYNNGKQAVVSVINGTDPTAVFGTDGTVSGNGTCNNYHGPYSTKDDTIKIGPLASTLMACADPAQQDQETQYLVALQSAATFQVKGKHLEMRTADGAIAAEFESR
jgi:heat shock protein HslJ